MPRTIDMTPSWSDTLPLWQRLAEAAYTGNATNPDAILHIFWTEMRRMAVQADLYRQYCERVDAAAGIEPVLYYTIPETLDMEPTNA